MTKPIKKFPKLPKFANSPKNPLVYLLVLFITLFAGFFSGSYYTTQKQSQLLTSGAVTRIIDADNLELNNNVSVRLNGIACPEKNEKFSQEAISYLTQNALNQKATLEYQPHYPQDTYGRTLAFVFINGQHLNEQLVRQGYCAAAVYSKRAKLIYQDELQTAQDQAKQEKLGRWE